MQKNSNAVKRLRGTLIGMLTVALCAAAIETTTLPAAAQPECEQDGRAWQITSECVDPLYDQPVIDRDSQQTSPSPHRRIEGHFEGTDIEFSIYLPPAEQYEGRFFQYTYPLTNDEADDRAIAFAFESGGYAVQAGNSTVSTGYRHAAAAARFAETVAEDYYGDGRDPYGYLYGPSGGSFQTVGAAENTTGIWDGFVPMVLGTPMSNPYNFVIRAAAELILGDKAEQISDAILPGGSGDPYRGLEPGESAMLHELTRFGVPLKAWEYPEYLLGWSDQYPDGLNGFGPDVDPTYVSDFWNKPGYLGTEKSALGEAVRAALSEKGDTEANRRDIASRFYYRYQLPPAEAGYAGFAQFRDKEGDPLYPQREPLWGPINSGAVSGYTAFDGSINGRMIVVSNLYDSDALPYQADWYAQRVESSLGSDYKDGFRIYYNDHADHQERPVGTPPDVERAQHLIDWYGSVEQALRDLVAWVEEGEPAPPSTHYTVEDAQIELPEQAFRRDGIQPTVKLRANMRGELLTVTGQDQVVLTALTVAPVDKGRIVSVAWDCDGDGEFEPDAVKGSGRVRIAAKTCSFPEPGSYFPAVKVSSARAGHEDDQFARVENLDRVRVVVTD